MAGLSNVFLDTNVLLAGLIDFGERSTAPMGLLDAVAAGRIDGPLTAWHCCLEFYSVATRLPEEYRLTPERALRFVQEEILARYEVVALPATHRQSFLTAAVAEGIVGGRIYDAHIAEVARRHGADTVVTDNRRHFTSLLRHGVRVLESPEALAELESAPEGDDDAP